MSAQIPLNEPIPIISFKQSGEYEYDRDCFMQLPKENRLENFPKPEFTVIDDYELSSMAVIPPPYILFEPQSNENLFDTVDYEMDEEDMAWLEIVNASRQTKGLHPVSQDDFEMLMDRFEKESYLYVKATGQPEVADDDAVCGICLEGHSEYTNLILFCDLCNLPVHQDCYGVPYVPEGQWLCRKCYLSPNQDVNCVLCPNTYGAFKQTDRGHWAHVLCALCVPEVQFGNTQFMEPIEGIENVPAARLKLHCHLCKLKNVGITVKCQKPNCKVSFHATCAQLKGLHLRFLDGGNSKSDAFCSNHSPSSTPQPNFVTNPQKNRNIPALPIEKIQNISEFVKFERKGDFILKLIAYWKLKRLLKRVSLLKRLDIP